MTRPSLAGQGVETLNLSDFELVRNAKGEWLLIVAQIPAAFLDNPLQGLTLQQDGHALVVQNAAGRLVMNSILASEYLAAFEADRPAEIFLSVVNDDGARQFSSRVACIWA